MSEPKITKKAAKAARVEATKVAAYHKKVSTLVGYVGPNVTSQMIADAIAAGKTAEAYAAELAALEPVGRAVFPTKLEAVKAAAIWANKRIAKATEELVAANWDIDVVAPRAHIIRDSREEYASKAAHRAFISNITKSVEAVRAFNSSAPHRVKINPEGVARFVANRERDAADQYDAFACKLVAKIGPCLSAELSGDHVWSWSILTVTKTGGVVERWKTQQITNVSVLGNYFPQWPTRLLKGGES